MKKNYTDITFVLDRSGSMASVATDTIGGFNRFIDDQKKASGTATVTLNQFDTIFETVYQGANVQEVKPLDGSTFQPRGLTALHDAIGRSINSAGHRLESLKEEDRPEKVVVVIVTDGYENASQEFTSAKIAEMISHQKDKYQWEFVFLGANQDAIAAAAKIHIDASNAMTFAHNAAGTINAFQSTSANLASFRSGASRTMAYSGSDRDLQAAAGA